jgi:hypothetical protein
LAYFNDKKFKILELSGYSSMDIIKYMTKYNIYIEKLIFIHKSVENGINSDERLAILKH